MGVFYRTDKSQYTDYVVQLPEELMLKAVDFYNKGVEGVMASSAKMLQRQYNTFNFAQEDLNRYYQEKYGKNFQQILDNVYKNPGEWKKYMQDLQKLGYQLAEDELRGNIAKWTRPYQEYMSKAKEYSNLVKKGKYNEESYNLWNLYTLQRTKEQYKNDNGEVDLTFTNEMGMPETQDLTKYLEEQLKNKFGEEGYSIVREGPNGEYIVKTKEGREGYISWQRVYDTAMQINGFIKDDKGNWHLNSIPDVGRYYFDNKYKERYLYYRNEERLDVDEAKAKAQEDALQYWTNIASNKAVAMANQLHKGKTINEQTIREIKETTTHAKSVGERIKNNIGDLLATTEDIDFIIEDPYFDRTTVDKKYTTYNNYFKNKGWLNDEYKDKKTKEILNSDEFKDIKTPTEFIEKVEDKYASGDIIYDDYIMLKRKYDEYKKLESSYNASVNYAFKEVENKFGNSNVVRDIEEYGEYRTRITLRNPINNEPKDYAVKIDKSENVYIYDYDNDEWIKVTGAGGGWRMRNITDPSFILDKVKRERKQVKYFHSMRDKWFEDNKDASGNNILGLDISSIDGDNFLLSKRLGRVIFTNNTNIEVVDKDNFMQALKGDMATVANKVIDKLNNVYANAKVDKDGNVSFVDAKGNAIAAYITVKKAFTVDGEQYLEVYVNNDDKALEQLGLSKSERETLRDNKNTFIVHIPPQIDLTNYINNYIEDYSINITGNAKKVLNSWEDPMWRLKEKAYTAYYQYAGRGMLEEGEQFGSVALPTKYGDYIEIRNDGDNIIVEFSNKFGIIEQALTDQSKIKNIINAYMDYVGMFEQVDVPATEETINRYNELLKKKKNKVDALKQLSKEYHSEQ